MKKPNPAALEKWYNIYVQWKKSGLNQYQWCKLSNIKYKSFHPAVMRYKFSNRKSTKEHVISSFPEAKYFFIYHKLINIHWSFDKLLCIATNSIPKDLVESSHFVFLNKEGSFMKIFFLDESGPNILFKRLEIGTFKMENSTQVFGDFFQL